MAASSTVFAACITPLLLACPAAKAQEPVLVLGELPGTSRLALDGLEFVHGEPVALGENGPRAVLHLQWPLDGRNLPALTPWLDDLQRRFAADGLRVVVVGRPAPLPDWPRPPAFSVAVSPDLGAVADHLVVTLADRAGRVLWRGSADAGVAGWIERALSAEGVAENARSLPSARLEDLGEIEDLEDAALEALARRCLEANPGNPDGWVLEVILAVERRGDPAEVRRVTAEACKHLALDGPAMGRFVEKLLRTTTEDPAVLQQAMMGITPAVFSARDWVPLQATYVKVLNQLGRTKEIERVLARLPGARELAPADALLLAEALAFGKSAREFAAPAQAFLEQGRDRGWEYAWIRHNVVRHCVGDAAAADQIAGAIVPHPANLNNECWYTVTKEPKRGRFNTLAKALAERLVRTDTLDAAEMDTAALAFFVNGEIARAVELQRRSVSLGGGVTYQRRLARYEAAARQRGIVIE